VIGAVYLDGGLGAAERVLRPFLDSDLVRGYSPERVVDPKSRLQQVCQQRFAAVPTYTLKEQTGPGHNPQFTFDVQAGPDVVAEGTGATKQAAQKAAAHAALQQLDVEERYELPDPQ
jgi:ribonuclease-3